MRRACSGRRMTSPAPAASAFSISPPASSGVTTTIGNDVSARSSASSSATELP